MLVAGPTSISGFKTLLGEACLPENFVYKRMSDDALIDSNCKTFTTASGDQVITMMETLCLEILI